MGRLRKGWLSVQVVKDPQLFANRVLERCVSTNDIVKELALSGFSHGTWVSTRVQEAGRGRLGREWQSIVGNLFLSVLVRVTEKAVWSWVPLTAAVAVVQCLREQFPELSPLIKWPNDIWVNGAKLGGILCEGSGNRTEAFIVIGLGLNCVSAPQGLDQPTSDLTSARGGQPTSADIIREPLLVSLLKRVDELLEEGPSKIMKDYEAWSVFTRGREVEWSNASNLQTETGIVQGIGPAGELLVISSQGTSLSLFAEDVKIRGPK